MSFNQNQLFKLIYQYIFKDSRCGNIYLKSLKSIEKHSVQRQ